MGKHELRDAWSWSGQAGQLDQEGRPDQARHREQPARPDPVTEPDEEILLDQDGHVDQARPRRGLLRKALQVSVVRSLYLSARFRAQIIVFRGTRVRLGAGARIAVDPGGRLLLGADDAGGTADYVRISAGGRLTVH